MGADGKGRGAGRGGEFSRIGLLEGKKIERARRLN